MMVKVHFMKVEGGSFYEGPFLPMSSFGLLRHISGAFVVGNQIKHGGRELDLASFGARRNFKDVRAQKFPHTDFFKTLTACRK